MSADVGPLEAHVEYPGSDTCLVVRVVCEHGSGNRVIAGC